MDLVVRLFFGTMLCFVLNYSFASFAAEVGSFLKERGPLAPASFPRVEAEFVEIDLKSFLSLEEEGADRGAEASEEWADARTAEALKAQAVALASPPVAEASRETEKRTALEKTATNVKISALKRLILAERSSVFTRWHSASTLALMEACAALEQAEAKLFGMIQLKKVSNKNLVEVNATIKRLQEQKRELEHAERFFTVILDEANEAAKAIALDAANAAAADEEQEKRRAYHADIYLRNLRMQQTLSVLNSSCLRRIMQSLHAVFQEQAYALSGKTSSARANTSSFTTNKTASAFVKQRLAWLKNELAMSAQLYARSRDWEH